MRLLCYKPSEEEMLILVVTHIPELTNLQREILQDRFVRSLIQFSSRSTFLSFLFYIGHFIITVGSLIVPALMSIQYSNAGMSDSEDIQTFQTNIYWITWFISVLVTTFNGVLTLFKIDKKYYSIHTITERIRSEGWQYFALTGRYTSSSELISTHANQFVEFCNQIERLKIKQSNEEYFNRQNDEKKETTSNEKIDSGGTMYEGSVIPRMPTFMKKLSKNVVVEPVIQDVIDTMIRKEEEKEKKEKKHTSFPIETKIDISSPTSTSSPSSHPL